MHSAFEEQPRHSVVVPSQMGVVGVAQSVEELAHPPHAPLDVHTRLPPQLFGVIEQALHAIVVASQIGVLPAHPEPPFAGSHSTHLPPTHSCLSSLLLLQSDASRHSTHDGSPFAGCTQRRSAPAPVQARFDAGSHTQVRPLQDFAMVSGQALPHAVH